MIKLIVIDDESQLCHGIAYHIPWEVHGIQLVGVAYDGESGIRLIEDKQPDIVLTDVRMPILSGLEMIEEVIKTNKRVRFIILSGHEEFSYAKKAISLGVKNYVLKPTGEEKIVDEVLKVKDHLIQELRETQSMELIQEKWNEYLPRLQEQFFQHWIMKQFSKDEIMEQAIRLQLPIFKKQFYTVAVFMIDYSMERDKEASRAFYDFSLLNSINENSAAENYRAFSASNGSTVVLFWSEKGDDKDVFIKQTNQLINLWLISFKRSLEISASAGIGRIIDEKERVYISFEQAKRALLLRDYFGYNVAISYEEDYDQYEVLYLESTLEKNLEMAMDMSDVEKAMAAISAYIDDYEADSQVENILKEIIFHLQSFFIRYIQSKGWFVHHVLDEPLFVRKSLSIDKETVMEEMLNIVNKIISYSMKKQNASRNQTIQLVLNKIDQKLYEEISLQEIADEVFVNSSYLSRLFSREIGQSFSNYVTERKMQMAKEWINKQEKVSTIANKLGYRDVSYFTKVFRKYWGVTPTEMATREWHGIRHD